MNLAGWVNGWHCPFIVNPGEKSEYIRVFLVCHGLRVT